MDKFEYKCECGQTTYFVFENNSWKRDISKHGNYSSEISCFNCQKAIQKPTKAEEQKATVVKTEIEPLTLPVAEPEAIDTNKLNKKNRR